MFCSNCGRENNGEAKFCAGCGTKIGKVSSFVEHTVDKYKDNEVNDRLIRIIKTIFNVGSIIVIICFVIALLCVIFITDDEKKSSNSAYCDVCYNVGGDLNEIYI